MNKNKLSPELYFLLASIVGSAVFGLGLDVNSMVCAMPGCVITILGMYNYIRLTRKVGK